MMRRRALLALAAGLPLPALATQLTSPNRVVRVEF